MAKQLTKIERLDQQFPGLADDVRGWLTRGIIARQVVQLLSEKYNLCLTPSAVWSFRLRRWRPELETAREERLYAEAAREVAQYAGLRASRGGATARGAK